MEQTDDGNLQVTSDGGKSWSNITGNLPAKAYVQIVREDPRNPSLLYAGTELGLFASYTGGKEWIRLGLKNLPHVAVHDIKIHPRENDLILATHGRSVWILDDATPVQQMKSDLLGRDAHLFPVRPAIRFTSRFTRYGIGDKVFAGPNPAYGALITYYLKDKPDDKTTFKVEILDQAGKPVQELNRPSKEKGMNRVTWNLRFGGAEVRQPPREEETPTAGPPRGPQALPGNYLVRLTLGDKKLEERVEVRLDPMLTTPLADLQSQLELTLKLRDMQSAVNTALRFLDSINEQLKHTQTTMKNLNKEPDKEMTKALEDYIKKVEELQDRLARRSEGLGIPGKSRVTDRIGDIFFSIDAPNSAPTPSQRKYFDEIQPEFRQQMGEVNKFISETVPQWNEKLRGWNAPTLTTRKPVEF